jgi:hypothetical protein
MSELTITHAGTTITQDRPGMGSSNERLNQMKTKVFSITPDTATEACATGDVIFQADELSNFMSEKGGTAIIQSICILDDDDHGKAIDIVFMDSTGLLDEGDDGGTIDTDDDTDSAPGQILGVVSVTNYFDGLQFQYGQKDNIGLAIKSASTTRSVYLAAVNRGSSSTWTAAGLHLKIGYIQD